MTGHPGPYVEMDGPMLWVPRTVPYLEARRIAREALEYGERLHYIGKADGYLLGFTRDCRCEEVCELLYDDTGSPRTEGHTECRVPAWAFERLE